jgi:SecD/SecF fusion protein
VRDELGNDYDFRRVEVVGPAISGELTRAATLGVLASLLVILIYIWSALRMAVRRRRDCGCAA